MSDPKKNIANKFSQFEPGVDDLVIDASWEKIKYFLPEEKKRRGFIFFTNPGFKISAIACCILLATFVIFYNDKQATQIEIAKPKNNTASTNKEHLAPKENAGISSEEKQIKSKSNVRQKEPENTNYPITGKVNDGTVNVRSEIRIRVKESVTNHPSLAATNQTNDTKNPVTNNSLPLNTKENNNAVTNQAMNVKEVQPSAISVENYFPATTATLDIQNDTLQYVKLEAVAVTQIPFDEPNDSVQRELFPIKRSYAIDAARKKKLSLEIIGGPNQAYSYIKYGEVGEDKSSNTSNLTGGIGALFQLNNKWNINAHAILNSNRLNYKEETVGNKIVGKKPPIVISVVGPIDTTICYKQVHSINTLSSKLNYNFQFGLGYTLLQKKRYNLEAFAQFCVRSTRYSFASENYQDKDTLFFTKTLSSGPLPNQVQTSEAIFKHDYNVISFGVIPGLALAYHLTNRLAFVFKPAYFYQLSKSSLNPEGKIFDLKQNNLFLNLGVRIKL